jgi:glycosyltransferase involved in cell wall biosynthesis
LILNLFYQFTYSKKESDCWNFYNLAKLFVFPSIYEGFGFPPLEAMACGCPVVCSNSASLPEICGDAALYVDALKPSEMALGIQEALSNYILRKELVAKGFSKAKQYEWKSSSEQFTDCLKNI